MSVKFQLNKKQIIRGQYMGILQTQNKETATPTLEMLHMGEVVGSVSVESAGAKDGVWDVRANIPSELLSDGVLTFLLVLKGETEILDQFSIIAGDPLGEDLESEIALLRAELDMLKRAFRRHCIETMQG